MALFPTKRRTGVWWKDHSLSLVVGAILVGQLVFTLWAGYRAWQAEQAAHGESIGFGADYLTWWWYETMQSTQADTYGVLLVVLATKWFFERDSAESNNPNDDTQG